jgi:hypothetical protein
MPALFVPAEPALAILFLRDVRELCSLPYLLAVSSLLPYRCATLFRTSLTEIAYAFIFSRAKVRNSRSASSGTELM